MKVCADEDRRGGKSCPFLLNSWLSWGAVRIWNIKIKMQREKLAGISPSTPLLQLNFQAAYRPPCPRSGTLQCGTAARHRKPGSGDGPRPLATVSTWLQSCPCPRPVPGWRDKKPPKAGSPSGALCRRSLDSSKTSIVWPETENNASGPVALWPRGALASSRRRTLGPWGSGAQDTESLLVSSRLQALPC